MTTPVDIGTLIERTPGVVGGRPRIAGTRMPVATIAHYWLAGNAAEQIVDRVFPHLDLAQVHAALAYYFANRQELDAEMEAEQAEYERLAAESIKQGGGPPWLQDRR
jgi:uncharacterized protein (DUF433 family)